MAWALDNAPEEDEEITAEEEQAVEEALEDICLGRIYTAEEAKRMLLG
jgi:hypothetical protein